MLGLWGNSPLRVEGPERVTDLDKPGFQEPLKDGKFNTFSGRALSLKGIVFGKLPSSCDQVTAQEKHKVTPGKPSKSAIRGDSAGRFDYPKLSTLNEEPLISLKMTIVQPVIVQKILQVKV